MITRDHINAYLLCEDTMIMLVVLRLILDLARLVLSAVEAGIPGPRAPAAENFAAQLSVIILYVRTILFQFVNKEDW